MRRYGIQYHLAMATMGPTTQRNVERVPGALVKLARAKTSLSQRQLADLAGVPQPTIAQIESGRRQPSWPLLCKILAAADLEPRVQLAPYDNHDDVLDATAARPTPAERKIRERDLEAFLDDIRAEAPPQ